MYQVVNTITCDIIDPASANSVFGFFMGKSRMSSFISRNVEIVNVSYSRQFLKFSQDNIHKFVKICNNFRVPSLKLGNTIHADF